MISQAAYEALVEENLSLKAQLAIEGPSPAFHDRFKADVERLADLNKPTNLEED